MTNQQHPITPPPELVEQWWKNAQQADYSDGLRCWLNYVATQAANWGADRELEACCEWASQFNYDNYRYQDELQNLRRPKPPSLKAQALTVLDDASDRLDAAHENIIRRALESLPS